MPEFVPITPGDVPKMLEMMQDFYAIDGYPIDPAQTAALLDTFIKNEQLGHAFLIAENGQIAGYLIVTYIFSFEYGGRIGFVDELFVADAFRGGGLGRAGVTFAQQLATKAGLKLLYLEIEPHNERARQLYAKAGFTTHKRALLQYKIT